MPDADLSLAVPAVFFGSVGTGQHCTSTRRLYLHCAIALEFLTRLQARYTSPALVPVDLLNARTLLGPLHSRAALGVYDSAFADLKAAGSEGGGRYEDIQRQVYTQALPHQLFTPATATHCAVPVP